MRKSETEIAESRVTVTVLLIRRMFYEGGRCCKDNMSNDIFGDETCHLREVGREERILRQVERWC